jgi:cell division protease FtsH
MVKEYGMSRLGRVNFHGKGRAAFLPTSGMGESEREYSEQTAREIDEEVSRIIDEATAEVAAILLSERAALEAVTQRLMDKEVIDGAELRSLLEQFHPGPKLVPGSDALEDRGLSAAAFSGTEIPAGDGCDGLDLRAEGTSGAAAGSVP